MNMPYAMYITGSDGKPVRFPVAPAKINIKVNNQNKTLTLINEGEVNLIKSPGLKDINIDELQLPSIQAYPFAVYEDGFHEAKYYLDKLEKWKKSKKPVHLAINRTSPDGTKLLWNTTVDVTIESYEIIEDAEKYGVDVAVKLKMKEYRYWGAKKTRKVKDKAKTYTVKKKDTLLKIARKQLGDGSKRKSIYKLNKKVIEAAAKKHGRKSSSNGKWLYPGTKLKLPK